MHTSSRYSFRTILASVFALVSCLYIYPGLALTFLPEGQTIPQLVGVWHSEPHALVTGHYINESSPVEIDVAQELTIFATAQAREILPRFHFGFSLFDSYMNFGRDDSEVRLMIHRVEISNPEVISEIKNRSSPIGWKFWSNVPGHSIIRITVGAPWALLNKGPWIQYINIVVKP